MTGIECESGGRTTSADAHIRVTRRAVMMKHRRAKYKVYIDDRLSGMLKQGETKEFSVPAGKHRVQITMSRKYGSGEWGVELRPGETSVFECRPARGLAATDFFRPDDEWIEVRPLD